MSYSFVDDRLTISKSIICNIVCRAIKEDEALLWISKHLSEQRTLVYAITAREEAWFSVSAYRALHMVHPVKIARREQVQSYAIVGITLTKSLGLYSQGRWFYA